MKRWSIPSWNKPLGCPKRAKKVIHEWVGAYKKGCEDFKKAADDNYKKVVDYFKTAKKTK
jgi:hypothetical protein